MLNSSVRAWIVAIATISTLLAGCTDSSSEEKSNKMTLEQEETYINELLGQEKMSNMSPLKFEEKMKKKIDNISEAGAAEIVDGYIFTIYQNLSKYSSKVQGFNGELLALKEEGIDFSKSEERETIKEELLKTFVKEVYENQLVLTEVGGTFNVFPNLAYVIEQYGSYMTEDMKNYINLSNEEMNQSFFNTETGEIDLAIVSNRIARLGDMVEKYPDSPYQMSFTNSISYYYEVYFGTNNELLEDSDNILKESVWGQYKKDAETHKDSILGRDLAVVLPVLEEHKGQMNPDVLEAIGNIVNSKAPKVQEESAKTEAVGEESVKATEEEVLEKVGKVKEKIEETNSK